MTGPLSPCDGGTRVVIQVLPRAKQTQVVGVQGGAIKIRIQAPPVDGAANEAIIAFLARLLDLPRRSVVIVTGHGGRRKVVHLQGISPDRAAAVMVAP